MRCDTWLGIQLNPSFFSTTANNICRLADAQLLPDLSAPPGAGNRLTVAHIYVALSQSKGREELMMMRPLTDVLKKVLSNHISEALWADD
jgi:hypothetical protein